MLASQRCGLLRPSRLNVQALARPTSIRSLPFGKKTHSVSTPAVATTFPDVSLSSGFARNAVGKTLLSWVPSAAQIYPMLLSVY